MLDTGWDLRLTYIKYIKNVATWLEAEKYIKSHLKNCQILYVSVYKN